ncbi:AEC family transporter [Oscillospiraceae bacterium LTW-04]|nr:AEC family transporter [Oscillospiraceae bacterium MB24-C1]
MQLNVSVILIETAKFCVLISIGFVAVKIGVFTNESLKTLSTFALKITLPAFLIAKLSAATTRAMLLQALPLLVVLPFWYALLTIGGVLTARLFKMPPNTARVHIVQYVMGNIGVMGMILILTTLGNGVGIYMASIYFLDQCIMWTVCENLSYPAEQKRKLNLASLKKALMTPTTIAFFIAFTMILLEWHPQNLIMDVLVDVGNSSKTIAMVFIGGTLATLDIKRPPFLGGVFTIIIIKMLLLPLFVFWVTGLLGEFLHPMARMALALTTALPSLFTMSMLARNNGTDYEYATMSVFVTTTASMVTIPLVSYLVNLMM